MIRIGNTSQARPINAIRITTAQNTIEITTLPTPKAALNMKPMSFRKIKSANDDYSNVKASYQIGFLDFTLFPDDPCFYVTNLLMNEQTPQILQLNNAFLSGSIDVRSVSDRIDEVIFKTNSTILSEHLQYCGIWKSRDGRCYRTKVPDPNKPEGRKLISRAEKPDLENAIIDWYKNLYGNLQSLKGIHEPWRDYKLSTVQLGTVKKLDHIWDHYFSGSEIIKKPLCELCAGDIDEWFVKTIKNHALTRRQFTDLKSLMTMMYDYALKRNIVQINLPAQIRSYPDRMFRKTERAPVQRVVYQKDTIADVIRTAEEKYRKTKNISYIAVCLNFTLGLRVGELVALESTDINYGNNTIFISREEVETLFMDEDGKIHRKGYHIEDHVKTESGIRTLSLTAKGKLFIEMALKHNRELGLQDGNYLFLNKKGHRIHANSIQNALKEINGGRKHTNVEIRDSRPSGNHAIRKTCISELHNSGLLSDDTIRSFAGHSDISTTRRCYIRQTAPITDYAKEFAVLDDFLGG